MTLRRLSEALRSIDLQALSQDSQLEIGLGLDTLDGSSAESISTSLEVRGVGIHTAGYQFAMRCTYTSTARSPAAWPGRRFVHVRIR